MNDAFLWVTSLTATFLNLVGGTETSLSALFWHRDVEGRLSFLHNKVSFLGRMDVGLLLTDPNYALSMVKAADSQDFLEAMHRVRQRRPAAVLFAAGCPGEEARRLALFGTPESNGSGYWGLLADCTALLHPEGHSSVTPVAGSPEIPLVRIGFGDWRVRHVNPVARTLLSFDENQPFEAYCPLFSEKREAICAALLFDGVWEGSLAFRGAQGDMICSACIRPLRHEQLIEVCLYPTAFPLLQKHFSFTRLKAALEKAVDERRLLETVFEHQSENGKVGGVLLSRIFQRNNRIVASAVGPLFGDGLPPSEYSYTGTIADDIVKEGLTYLIEEETVRSTRPVDWVIYVPRGISSYCAVPFFTGNRLDLVLVFCSQRPRAFGVGDIPLCREILRLLAEHIRRVDEKG